MTLVVNGYEESSRSAIHKSILLTSEAHRRRVHDGHHLRYIFTNKTVEQVFVAIL